MNERKLNIVSLINKHNIDGHLILICLALPEYQKTLIRIIYNKEILIEWQETNTNQTQDKQSS